MTAIIIAIVAIVIILIYITVLKFKAEKPPNVTITCFTGSPGSGKSTMATIQAVSAYKKQLKHYKRRNYPLYQFFVPASKYPPSLYSNTPIKIGKNKWSNVLTREQILLEEILPEKAFICIDEFGSLASQWEFDNPLVMENLTTFVRFYRHFTDGKIFLADQTSDSIVKPVRSRLGIIYYLYDFRRVLGILPWVKINCIPLIDVEETATRLTDTMDRYFIVFLPYKWLYRLGFFKKIVDSRCYSDLYFKPAQKEIKAYTGYKTEYLIDIGVSDDIRKDYKKDRPKYRRYLYDKPEIFEEPKAEPKTIKGLIKYVKEKIKLKLKKT